MQGSPVGLRERKKRRTRETIARVALELFAAQGYRATTIAQIAEAADVSPRTVSTYFPAKEDLLFAPGNALLDQLVERLRSRPPDTYAVDALRDWIAAWLDELAEPDLRTCEQSRRRVIDSDESLRAYELRLMERVERHLRAEIARDLGVAPDDVAARLAAAAALSALDTVRTTCDAADDPAAARAVALAKVDQAIAFLRGGIAALRDHRHEPRPDELPAGA